MQSDEIKVSIHCLTYNHEKYLRKTFDSFLFQKTNFKFEVLVHDDASTDNTQEIIREYAEKYPDIFKPLCQKENQHSKGVRVSKVYNLPRAIGKYVAYCEGDDYWSDADKLQKQYDIMEQHPECSMCVHPVRVVSENGALTEETIPRYFLDEGVIEEREFLRQELINGWAAQTSSYFVRNEYLQEYLKEWPSFAQMMMVGDLPLVLYMITRGKIYFGTEMMSCYRMGAEFSFRKRRQKNPFFELRYLCSLLGGIEEYDRYTNGKYKDLVSAYKVIKLEQTEKLERKLRKEYEPDYLQVVYQGKEKSIRMQVSYFVRKRLPFIYKLLLRLYEKVNGL